LGLISQREKRSIFLKPISHWELISKAIRTRDGLAFRGFAGDSSGHPWFRHVVADPKSLPLRIARTKTGLSQLTLLFSRDFVVGDRYTLPAPTVLFIQPHHSMGSRARACKEV